MKLIKEPIPGLLVIKPDVYQDNRGYFTETYSNKNYRKFGIDDKFVQDNLSVSKKNVLRGLHFQIKHVQSKLIQVSRGKVFDVNVDIRPKSETFGKWHAEILSEENNFQIFIPPGFAHGFCVMSEIAYLNYKCSDYYYQDDQGGITWDDSDLAINWPVGNPIISHKDNNLPSFTDYFNLR